VISWKAGAVAKVIALRATRVALAEPFGSGFAVQAAGTATPLCWWISISDQQTSFEWRRRGSSKHKPESLCRIDRPGRPFGFRVGHRAPGVRCAGRRRAGLVDERTLRLAAIADLMVLPATPTVADLRPTIRLMHELKGQGIPHSREVIAFNHVRAARELTFARTYLKEAGSRPCRRAFASS